MLARALLNAPPIILADEPTGNIDPETSYRLVELLKDICDSGKTVVIATHQYDLIKHFPGKVFRCENGVLQEDVLFFSPSYAAMFVIGKSANGLTIWKDEDGHSLKEIENSETREENK